MRTPNAPRARLELNTLIGLSGPETDWSGKVDLPLPPPDENSPEELRAMSQTVNLQLLAARQEVAVMEGAVATTRRFRLLGGTDIGYQSETDADGRRLSGPTLPYRMVDGVKEFHLVAEEIVHEFPLVQHGTHMYHPHADEMTQLAYGMMGLFIIHPRVSDDPNFGSPVRREG